MAIRKELVKIGKKIVKEGLVISKGGNISSREGRYILFNLVRFVRFGIQNRKGYKIILTVII